DKFFDELIDIKDSLYGNGKFQMQFSIHSTDMKTRDDLIPVKKWSFEKIALYGDKFFKTGDKKISLNFALEKNSPIDLNILAKYFDPSKFLLKLTPVNPTITAQKNNLNDGLVSLLDESNQLLNNLKKEFEVIISIGELEENLIGSNCGQYIRKFIENSDKLAESLYEKSYNYLLKSY
ncbi:MAG: radical SAM protein, partial [Candidatus Zixiibacteriota bacterium]